MTAKHQLWRIWHAVRPDTIRRAVAGIMLIIGLGRLGVYASRPVSGVIGSDAYGVLLVGLGLAMYSGRRWQKLWPGRLTAAVSALLLFTMAWEAAAVSVGVTALLEAWLALLLLFITFTEADCA